MRCSAMGMPEGTVNTMRRSRRGRSDSSRLPRWDGELMVTRVCMITSPMRNIMMELRVNCDSKAISRSWPRYRGCREMAGSSKQLSGVPMWLTCWAKLPRVTMGS